MSPPFDRIDARRHRAGEGLRHSPVEGAPSDPAERFQHRVTVMMRHRGRDHT